MNQATCQCCKQKYFRWNFCRDCVSTYQDEGMLLALLIALLKEEEPPVTMTRTLLINAYPGTPLQMKLRAIWADEHGY